MGSSYLPPPEQNVVNVGDELSQSAIDAINAAVSPSGANAFLTASQAASGPAGPAGPAGADGQPGPAGADGAPGPAGPTWTFAGAFDWGRTYNQYEVVEVDGSSYVMFNYIGAAGYYPPSYPSYWQLIAARGPQGADGAAGSNGSDGAQGPQGPAGQAVINWRGYFDYYTYYNTNDAVSYEGSSYLSTGGGGNQYPYEGSSYWAMLAKKGDQGNSGGDGSQGPEGPQGPAGAGVINWRGNWDYSTYYYQNDAVSYDGSSYICFSTNSYNTPYEGSGYWGLLARKGDQGPQGNDGSGGGGGSNPYYYHSVWAYNTWYSANVTTVYDTNYNYVNVLTF